MSQPFDTNQSNPFYQQQLQQQYAYLQQQDIFNDQTDPLSSMLGFQQGNTETVQQRGSMDTGMQRNIDNSTLMALSMQQSMLNAQLTTQFPMMRQAPGTQAPASEMTHFSSSPLMNQAAFQDRFQAAQTNFQSPLDQMMKNAGNMAQQSGMQPQMEQTINPQLVSGHAYPRPPMQQPLMSQQILTNMQNQMTPQLINQHLSQPIQQMAYSPPQQAARPLQPEQVVQQFAESGNPQNPFLAQQLLRQQQSLSQMNSPNMQQQYLQYQKGMMQARPKVAAVPENPMKINSSKIPNWIRDRAVWEQTFNKYLTQVNLSTAQIPLVAGSPLDLYQVFNHVVQCGGFQEVVNNKLWTLIAQKMSYENISNITSFLFRVYQSFLLQFENAVIPMHARVTGVEQLEKTEPDTVEETQPLEKVKTEPEDIPQTLPIKTESKPEPQPEEGSLLAVLNSAIAEAAMEVKTEVKQEKKEYWRKMTSYGGIELDHESMFKMIDQISLPSKEFYAPYNPFRVLMSLKSGLDLDVRFALVTLLFTSFEGQLYYKNAPGLLETILDLFQSGLAGLIEDKAPSPNFVSYKTLFDASISEKTRLCDTATKTLNLDETRVEKTLIIGQIIRNSSFIPDNLAFLAQTPQVLDLVFWTLNLPLGKHLTHSVVLEFRKNAFTILGNLATAFTVPNTEFAQLLHTICADFITEPSTPYCYCALEMYCKLLLIPANQRMFSEFDYREMVDSVFLIIPQQYHTDINQEKLALWEMAMTFLLQVVMLNSDVKDHVYSKYSMRLLALLKKPSVNAFDTQRERVVKIFAECVAMIDVQFEHRLLDVMLSCLVSHDQVIANFIGILLNEISMSASLDNK
ncbi:hypothetical protein EDD86DRAFT_208588 [Gorgonomyces haynaldii]|nr:hypothetical protein EDD86DRAFT_208588 [Gorgonomyces haynaldii]